MCVFACVSSRGCIRYTNTTAARSSRCSFWRAFFFALCAVPCCAARLHHGALTGGLPAAAASHDRVCPPCKLSYTIRSLHAGMPCRYGVYFGVLGRDCAEVASGESLRCLLPSLSLQLRAPTRKAYPPNCTCTSTHARTLTHTRAHTSRRMDRYARTRARARAYIKARGQKCTHTCTHAHILQGAWTDIHAHVHTRAHTSRCMDRHARTCAHARADRMASSVGSQGRKLVSTVNSCGICNNELKDFSHLGDQQVCAVCACVCDCGRMSGRGSRYAWLYGREAGVTCTSGRFFLSGR